MPNECYCRKYELDLAYAPYSHNGQACCNRHCYNFAITSDPKLAQKVEIVRKKIIAGFSPEIRELYANRGRYDPRYMNPSAKCYIKNNSGEEGE
jgi:hypothetical protein